MKIFFLGTDYPYPGFSGACVMNWTIVNHLISEGHEVTLFVDPPRLLGQQIDERLNIIMKKKIRSLKCDFVTLSKINKKISKKNFVQLLFSNKFEDYFSSCLISEEIGQIIKKKVNEIKPDLLICWGSPAIHWVKDIDIKKAGIVHVPSLINYANLITNYEINGLSFRVIKDIIIYLKSRLFDKKIIKEANKISIRFHHSKDFSDIMLKRGLKDCKYLFPTYFDHRKYYNKEVVRKKRDYFKIIIVGLMSTVNKAQYYTLQKYVFPYLEKNLDMKKVQFHMIGTNHEDMPKYFQNKKYVFARGYVEDFNFELQDCDLFYCYTPFALGLRTRLLDALNFQTAIITSDFDIKSLPYLKHKSNCYVANDKKNIGALIIEIMNDKNIENIRSNARKTYEKYISTQTAGKIFSDTILYDKA